MTRYADNHYARLGVPRDATPEEILKAYREAAKRYHPDTRAEKTGTELFLGVQEAFDVLSNPQRRAAYDLTLPPGPAHPPVQVDIHHSRTSLLQTSAPQLFYTLLSVQALRSAEERVIPPFNLCLVIDRSTSMAGPRMDMLKATVRQLLSQLRPTDIISVVAFSDRAEVVIPPGKYPDIARVDARISMLQTNGATEIFQGLNVGFGQVAQNTRAGFLNHLILITDGHTYGDEEACYTLAEQAKEQQITISGLGIGTEWNDAFLDKLVGITGGSSTFVSQPKDIKHYLEKKFQGMNKTFAEALRLDLSLAPQVELKYAFRLRPEPAKIPIDTLPVALGNLQYEEETQLVLEFLVHETPAEKAEFSLGKGRILMDIPTWVTPVHRLAFQFPVRLSAEHLPETPPAALLEAMSKLTLYRMQEQARQEIKAGQIPQATRRLQNLATNLLTQGEAALAASVLSEARRLERGQGVSAEGDKRIKYGTRALAAISKRE